LGRYTWSIKMGKKAIVFLSGGADSATCLAIAKSQGFTCYAITFEYGQRHLVEIEYAKRFVQKYQVELHNVFQIDINQWKGSALTDHELDVPHQRSTDIPITYVPARNTIFLSFALGWAEVLGVNDIFFGANCDDKINYPDCRPEYITAFETVANLATRAGVEGQVLKIHTPLIEMNKAEIFRTGLDLGIDYDDTFSCYDPTPEQLSCGQCDACFFRKQGLDEALKMGS
jgi:7-cyano-7-deazaguanine synthase